MKKRLLPLLIPAALAAAAIAPIALAAVTLNGEPISDVSIVSNGVDFAITYTGGPVADPDPDPDPGPDPDPDPDPEPGPIDVGDCGTESQDLVFETLSWDQQPGQTLLTIPRDGVIASKVTTTSSRTYYGNVNLVPTSGTGYVTRKLWISSCPGGPPVDHRYNAIGYGCTSTGSETSVRWSQEVAPSNALHCKLQPNTTYYLNYENVNCNAGTCGAYRNTRRSYK
jgi:hypothetical protein